MSEAYGEYSLAGATDSPASPDSTDRSSIRRLALLQVTYLDRLSIQVGRRR